MRVLVCAGGTGGGIYPALSAVAELEQLGVPRSDILWLGVRGEMEEQLIPRAGLTLERIEGGAIAGVSRLTQLKNLLKLAGSTLRSWRIIGRFRPRVVLVTGGYMSVPVALAARLRRAPLLVFLPDIEPGAAIRFISRLTDRVAATFRESLGYFPRGTDLVATGYPLRPEIAAAAETPRSEARAAFDLRDDLPLLFVFGGSRGAWSINQALMANLPEILAETQVVHISGELTWEQVEANSRLLPAGLRERYRPFPYLHENMGLAFRAADLVVARAGASMLGEAPLFGLPSVLVPYPHAWQTQKINADYLVDQQAAVRLDDEHLEAQLLPTILNLLADRERLAAMSAAARQLHTPAAARKLAQTILDLGQGRLPAGSEKITGSPANQKSKST